MFNKKKCTKCNEKVKDSYDFCPTCGNTLRENSSEKDFGMLGKNDFVSQVGEIRLPTGLNLIFNSLMKSLDKQFTQMEKGIKRDMNKKTRPKGNGISISISSGQGQPPEIKVQSFGKMPQFDAEGNLMNATENKVKKKEIPSKPFNEATQKRFSALERHEPKTDIRRLSNKLTYELSLPGVKSLDDISIVRLESSIEIKAIANKKAYQKIIPMSMPIRNTRLSKGKLILEMDEKE